MDLADVSKGRPAPTRGPHTSASQRGGARWTKSTRGLGACPPRGWPRSARSRSDGHEAARLGHRHGMKPARPSDSARRRAARRPPATAARRGSGHGERRRRKKGEGTVGILTEDGDGETTTGRRLAAERDGERGGGVPGAGRGNGVGAGVRRGTAMPMAVVAQRGSDGSGGGARLEVTKGGCGSVHGGNGAAGVEGEDGVDAGVWHDAAKLLEAKARPGEAALAGGERMEAAKGEGGSGWRWKRRCGGGLAKRSGGRGAHGDCGAGEGDGAVRGWREWRLGAAGARRRAATARFCVGRAGESAGSTGKLGKRGRVARGSFL
uniref:Retrotransposon protein, putative, unclassified n=1 Tax=Oryza sativa subsp. japonica TaxID=39947 RepID=Q7XDU5_ORYSJ|nr:retrotransposon protein, putative, unclassified [Oryza sativa Japonica Group]